MPVWNTCVMLVFAVFFCAGRGELLMSVWMLRHGARETKRPHNYLLQNPSEGFRGNRILKNIGTRQHYILGRLFKQMYEDQIPMTPGSVIVRSTAHGRTFSCGLSFLRGIVNATQNSSANFTVFVSKVPNRIGHKCPST